MSMFQREGLRAVIFDIDGTLVDSFSVYLKVFNEGIADHDIGPVAQDFLDNCLRKGKGLREILKGVFPLDTDEAPSLRAKTGSNVFSGRSSRKRSDRFRGSRNCSGASKAGTC